MYLLKIKIKSFKNIENIRIKYLYIYRIKQFLKKKKIKSKGNIQLKKKKKIYTVLRSPHVNKKSMEHFSYDFYKKKIHLLIQDFYILINFIIVLKKILPKNLLLKFKIKKCL